MRAIFAFLFVCFLVGVLGRAPEKELVSPSQKGREHIECKWAKAMRSDQSIQCERDLKDVEPKRVAPRTLTKQDLIEEVVKAGGNRQDAERSFNNFDVALRNPTKRRLLECLGINVYDVYSANWTAPTDAECKDVESRLRHSERY